MCGIAAMIGLEGRKVDAAALERMAFSLQHRGPDDKGVYINGSIGFGFRRLSILDLSPNGHQPKVTRDGKKVLVFNGEIYNYIELREELLALGYVFESSGDTEVLLAAYSQWGVECLPRLNGMWAFLIYDAAEKKIFGSRDRFGVKPLFRYSSDDLVLFGSEIKAILSSGYYQSKINWNVAAGFLVENRLDVDEETFYAGIEQVPAGSAFELYLDGRRKVWSYWSLDNIEPENVAHPCEAFKELFDDAVRLRMRSDVPVGVCLSGGLDSTSIICSMANVMANSLSPLEAFSYMSRDYDESRYISDTIEFAGAHLNKLEVDPALLVTKLKKVIWYHDGPVHGMTGLVGFELMSLAAKAGVKVILNGQGADETIAGYHSYFGNHWGGMLRKGQCVRTWKEIKQHALSLGSNPYARFFSAMLPVLLDGIAGLSLYRTAAAWRHRLALDPNGWFTPEFLAHAKRENYVRCRSLEDVLKMSVRNQPLPVLLRIEDRNSMAHSIEVRLPFLDYRLVTLLFRLSSDWKMRGAFNKYILRQSMAGNIPESVRTRVDKMGFPVPSKEWVARAWYEPLQDMLASREMKASGLYNLDNIRRDLQSHHKGINDVSCALFNVAQFQMWLSLNDSIGASTIS